MEFSKLVYDESGYPVSWNNSSEIIRKMAVKHNIKIEAKKLSEE